MRRGLALVVFLALVTGCSSSGPAASADPVTSSPLSTASDSPSSTTSPTPTDDPSSSGPTMTPSATPTPFKTTDKAHATPWTNKHADFGWVTDATVVTGGVTFQFDRAEWLLPDQVAAWNKANPGHQVEASDDYAIGNISKQKRTFFVRTGAQIFGSIILADQVEPTKITAAQFAARIDSTGKPGVTCWLFHQYGELTGDVVQLEEQYRP